MLTIRAMSNGAGYSARHLQHSDYYAEGERVTGQWQGRGAEMLGLAGEVQSEQFEALRQGVDPEGRIIRFTPPDSIEQELKHVFDELANEDFLEGLPRREFARRVAGLFSEINRIHPFREGNGRAQRQFVRQLADSLGFKLHFEVVSKERLIQASILSANGDVAMMERLFDEITDTERIQSLTKVIAHFERSRFAWNDIYVATTTPGQSYAGTFAGSDGANFFFRDDENRILVGNLKDLKRAAEPGEKIGFTAS